MVLSDVTIKEQIEKGNIVIDPLDQNDIQPASVDVHLDNKVLVFRNSRRPYIDIREDLEGLMDLETIDDETPFILHPGEFILGSTLENIEILCRSQSQSLDISRLVPHLLGAPKNLSSLPECQSVLSLLGIV